MKIEKKKQKKKRYFTIEIVWLFGWEQCLVENLILELKFENKTEKQKRQTHHENTAI